MSLSKSRFIEMFGNPNTNSLNLPEKPIKNVCQNLDYKREPITSSERVKGKYPYYGASGIVDWVDNFIFDDDLLLVSEDGENLSARVTPIAFSIKGKTWVNNHAHVLKFDDLYMQNYVEYFFNQLDLTSKITGTAQPKFLLQKILEKLELLKKSRFIEMFGDLKENQNYRTILFSQCTKSMIKGPFGSDMKKSLYVPKGKDTYKVYIQLNAIQRNQSLGNYYISKDYFDKKISRFEVKPNDFIITCDGTLGKLLQLDENMEKGVISSSLLKITLDETVIDSSFFEILWTNVILPNLSRYTRNACLVHLPSVSTIGNLEFHLPDLYLQKEYTKLVKQIDKPKFNQKALNETMLPIPSIESLIHFKNLCNQIDKSKLVIQKSLEDLVGKS